MQTKGAIGNLINRYRAVLKKCNLLNTFGTLAIASAIAMSGVSAASAADIAANENNPANDYELVLGSGADNVTTNKGGEFTINAVSGGTSGVTAGTATIGAAQANADGSFNATKVTLNDNLGTGDLTVDASKANAELVIAPETVYTVTGAANNGASVTLKGTADQNVGLPNFVAGNAAKLTVDEGAELKLVSGNAGTANNIDGGTASAANNQILDIFGTVNSLDNNGSTAEDLTIGNTNGVTVNVKEKGKLNAAEVVLNNGSALNVDGNIVINAASTNADYGVDAAKLTVTDGSVKADTIDVRAATGLVITKGTVEANNVVTDTVGTFAIAADGTLKTETLELGKEDFSHTSGTLAFGTLKGGKDVKIDGGTVELTADQAVLVHTADNSGSVAEVLFGINGGTLKANELTLSGFDTSTNVLGKADHDVKLFVNTLNAGNGVATNGTDGSNNASATVITINSQEGVAEHTFLTGDLTLKASNNGSNDASSSLVLGTQIGTLSADDAAYDYTYRTDSTITLAGSNANGAATITSEYGNWEIANVTAGTAANAGEGTVEAKANTSIKINEVNALTANSVLNIAGNGTVTLGNVNLDDSGKLNINTNAAITGAINFDADGKNNAGAITIADGKNLTKTGGLTIAAADLKNTGAKINFGSNGSTLNVDNLTLGVSGGNTELDLNAANNTIIANTLKVQGDKVANDLTLKNSTLQMAAGAEEGQNPAITANTLTIGASANVDLFDSGSVSGAVVANGAGATLDVLGSQWSVASLDVQNGTVTVGSGLAASELTVSGALKTTATNGSVAIQNLGTLTAQAANLGLDQDFTSSTNVLEQITVSEGGTLRVEGLTNLKADNLQDLKNTLMTGNGLLDIAGASVADAVVDGKVDYSKVEGFTSDAFKNAQAVVKIAEKDGLKGGFGSILLDSEKTKDVSVTGTLELTGADGVLAVNKANEVLNVNIDADSALTVGNKTAGTNGSGSLGDITFDNQSSSKFNAVNGEYAVASLGADGAVNGVVTLDNAKLGVNGNVNVHSLSATGSSLTAKGDINAEMISLGGENAVVSAQVGAENTGNITVTGSIAGSGTVMAEGDVTLDNNVASLGMPGSNLAVQGANINLGDLDTVGAFANAQTNTPANQITLKADKVLTFAGNGGTTTFNGADVSAGAFAATGATVVNGGSFAALGGVTDNNGAVANSFGAFTANNAEVSFANDSKFTGAFTAADAASAVLGGETEFAAPVTAQNTPAAGEEAKGVTSVVISKIADSTANNTAFAAQGQFADEQADLAEAAAFLQVQNFSKEQANAYTFTAGDNGFLSFGSMSYDEMMNHYEKFVGESFELHSAAAVGTAIDLTKNTVNVGDMTGVTAGDFNVGKGGLLIADVSVLDPAAAEPSALLKGEDGSNSVVFADGSAVHLVGAKAGKEYIIADDVVTGDLSNTDINKSTDNRLVIFDSLAYGEGDSADQIIASTSLADVSKLFPMMDVSLQGILGTYASTGAYNSFLDKALYSNNGMSDAQVANAIESAAKAPMVAGAATTAINIATMAADYTMARTSFAQHVAGAAAVDENGEYSNISAGDNMANGMNLWIMPMYQNSKVDGLQSGSYELGFDSDFAGVAVGADYTWDNSFRLGAAVNMGTGSSESKGALAYTENDYDSVGFGLYAGYMIGSLGLSADINYTNISNDIAQTNPVMALAAEGDTDVLSVGVRAEYKIATEMMDIVPHVGLRYSNISMDSMNFSGILTAEADSANVWQMPIGVTFAKDIVTDGGWTFTPSVDLSVIPAFGDTELAQTAMFTGVNGIASMNTEILDSVSGRAQVGFELSKDQFYMGLDYAYQGSSNMDTHGVQATFGFKF